MKTYILCSLGTLLFVGTLYSQQVSLAQVEVNGVAKAADGSVIGGMNLIVARGTDKTDFPTDIDGNFKLKLEGGEYVVTVNKVNSPDFKLHLKIQGAGLNPDSLVLTLDPSKFCCSSPTGGSFPLPVKISPALFPPAAIAIRATGEVTVDVNIKQDGTVEAAVATSGHPLLRGSARKAALESLFEAGPEGTSREATLTYVFVHESSEKPGISRYSNPYRYIISPTPSQLNSYYD